MARVLVADHEVCVSLNAVEKLLALRCDVSIPLGDVRSASVVDRPWDVLIPSRVSMGFAASGAPLGKIATVGPRARCGEGKALVVVYRNRPSIVVDIDPAGTGWSLIVVSVQSPENVLARLVDARPEGRRS